MAVQTRRVSSLLSVSVVAGVALMGMMSCGGQGHTSDEMPMVGDVQIMSMETPTDSNAIRPFTFHVPDEVLADLQARLSRTRLPDQIPGTQVGTMEPTVHI